MGESETLTIPLILLRLVVAAAVGGVIGYERRMHHKSIGIAGMVLIAVGSATYMLLAKHLTVTDPSAIGRLLQGFFSGIGFLGGAVIFKGGTDVRGIKDGCRDLDYRRDWPGHWHLAVVAGDYRCGHYQRRLVCGRSVPGHPSGDRGARRAG